MNFAAADDETNPRERRFHTVPLERKKVRSSVERPDGMSVQGGDAPDRVTQRHG